MLVYVGLTSKTLTMPVKRPASTSATSETQVSASKSKRPKDTPPPWFTSFIEEHREVNANLVHATEEMLAATKERNAILKSLTDALIVHYKHES